MADFNKNFLPLKYIIFASALSLILFSSFSQAYTVLEAEGYRVQMFLDPDPITAQKENSVTLKVSRIKDITPVIDGNIWVIVNEINDVTNDKDTNKKPLSIFNKSGQTDMFGDFEFKAVFQKKGEYQIKVELMPPGLNTETKQITMSFTQKVNPSERIGIKLMFILFLLLGLFTAGIFIIKLKTQTVKSNKINLLDAPIIKGFFKTHFIQPFIQIILLIFLLILIFLALFDIQDSSRNLSVILIWTIWWAGVIFTFVLAGRFWCYMCPVGAISEWVSRRFQPHRIWPRNFQNMWFANAFFILLTWLDIQIGVVRNPMVTGLLLTSVIVMAVGIGIFYKRRTFCRYLCPIGGIIGLYSQFSPIELRAKDLEVCRCHKKKDCYIGNDKGLGCPMFELVPKMDNNKACNFCGECIKSCPKDNISIRFRPFFKDAWGAKHLSLDDAVLTIVLVGVTIFVTGDMLEPWPAWVGVAMTWFPADFFGIQYQYTIEVLTKSFLYFFISIVFIPGLILLFTAISNRLAGRGNYISLKQTMITFGVMFIPIGLSMHLAHNIGHLLNESLKIIPAMQRTINKYLPIDVGEPDWQFAFVSLADPLLIYWMQMTLFISFYGFSFVAGYRLAMKNYNEPQTAFRALLPMVCIAGILMAINIFLLNLPMAPRHIH
jgi:polyferredoxin